MFSASPVAVPGAVGGSFDLFAALVADVGDHAFFIVIPSCSFDNRFMVIE